MERPLETILNSALLDCKACPLGEFKKSLVVPGLGPFDAKYMLVGEGAGPMEAGVSPNQKELGIAAQYPFVHEAPAGSRLTQLLERVAGIPRSECYLTNVVKHMPTDNGKKFRAPYAAEKKACRHWLDEELQTVNPEVILAIGDHAIKSFITGVNQRTSHGLTYELEDGKKLVILYHPSYYNRKPTERLKIAKDYAGIKESIKNPIRLPDFPYTILKPSNLNIVRRFVRKLMKHDRWAFDFETSDTDPYLAKIVGISFSNGVDTYYLYTKHFDNRELLECFVPFFKNPNITKVAYNVKFEMKIMIVNTGDREPLINYEDPMLMAYLLGHEFMGLKENVLRYLQIQMTELKEIMGTGKKKRGVGDIPADEIGPYGAADSYYTLKLFDLFKSKLPPSLEALYYKEDLPLAGALARTEVNGVDINWESRDNLAKQLQEEIDKVVAVVHEIAGKEFNLNSTDELRTVLFEELKLKSRRRTAVTKVLSTDDGALQALKDAHPIIEHIMEYREKTKLLSTYVKNFIPHPVTGKLHSEFNAVNVRTRRTSSGNGSLNFQNIPRRGAFGDMFRSMFISPAGWYMIKADSAQQELRILAHFSQDENMLQAFGADGDLHMVTAKNVLTKWVKRNDDEDYGEYLKRLRNDYAKTLNFGIIYGLTPAGVAKQLGCSFEEGQQVIDDMMRTYPGIETYREECKEFLAKNGYVLTVVGGRLYIHEYFSNDGWWKEEAIKFSTNYRIQGTGGEVLRIGMVEMDRWLLDNNMRSQIVLQVHDEIVLAVHPDEVGAVTEAVETALAPEILSLPLVTEAGIGDNWHIAGGDEGKKNLTTMLAA